MEKESQHEQQQQQAQPAAIDSMMDSSLVASESAPPFDLRASTGFREEKTGQDVLSARKTFQLNQNSVSQMKAVHSTACGCSLCIQRQMDKVASDADRSYASGNVAAPVLQRTVWKYDGTDWKDGDTVGEPAELPEREHQIGDIYDDQSGQYFSGRNAAIKGEPNRFRGYQDASEEDEQKMRAGLARAKFKLHKVKAIIDRDELAIRGGGETASPEVIRMLELVFGFDRNARRYEHHRVVHILQTGINRLIDGLSAEGVELISTTRMVIYGIAKPANDCSGFVPRGLTEGTPMDEPLENTGDFTKWSRGIHLVMSMIGNAQMMGDTIIHEATHKFLGAYDYSYVGAPGSVETGLRDKVGALQEEDEALGDAEALAQVKTDARNRAYAQLIQNIVSEGIKSILPMGLERGRDIQNTDSDKVVAAKQAWARVKRWGIPGAAIPGADELETQCQEIIEINNLPSSLKSTLRSFLASDKEKFMAGHGNENQVKGHDIFSTLSTKYLLKNADSWTELIVDLAS